jgi:cobyrinic acid a,c-diamide synthase
MSASPRGVIITAPSSGAGKTTVTLGLLRALARRGVAVQPFKCGPDYIDTAFHTAAARRTSVNLDTWAMRPQLIGRLLRDAASGAEVCIAEGVMGLYDGASTRGTCGNGSTADLAALTGWPVVLVLDVEAQAETAAAVALGLRTYRRDMEIAGVILNRVGSPKHAALVTEPLARIGIPVLGVMQRRGDIVMPERHLGLVQADETATLDQRLEAIADTIAQGIDLDRLVAAAQPLTLTADGEASSLPPPGQRIALAQDGAFSFVYAHLLSGWRQAGAEIVPFSPLADQAPAADCDAVWLPGGYPELHAAKLAGAQRFRAGMRAAAERAVPIHGECGGYMALGEGLVDAAGVRHEMLGLLGVETSFAAPRMHLGYRRARLRNSGTELVGHEFHFAALLSSTDEPLADIRDAAGGTVPERGSRRGAVTGTFFHVIDGAA